MVEVVPKFPHESYNVFSLVVTGLFFYWAYNAIIRFYRAMLLRSAVASGLSFLSYSIFLIDLLTRRGCCLNPWSW
jgi:hypothetical protein